MHRLGTGIKYPDLISESVDLMHIHRKGNLARLQLKHARTTKKTNSIPWPFDWLNQHLLHIRQHQFLRQSSE